MKKNQRILSLIAAFIIVGYAAFTYLQETFAPSAPVPTVAVPTGSVPTGSVPTVGTVSQPGLPAWLTVTFTDPNPPDVLGKGIDQSVLAVLNAATKTIDLTSFDLNLPDGINALTAAAKRGVKVRVVYDGVNGSLDLDNAATNNQAFDAIKALTTAKIPLSDGGRSNGLMHDKIIIVDSKILFMGSWNLSYNDTYRNNNNLLKITDPTLIANYQAKFNEMFVDKRFGTKAQVKALTPSINIGGVQVENYFSPPDQVMSKLIAAVKGAQKKIHFMAFTYTDKDLSAAMIERFKAKVEVQGVIENRGASQGAMVPLYCAKLPVKADGNKYTMHHKVIIIDDQTVITGSFNFTKSADDANDDNVLIIHSPAVAALYEQEFQKVYTAGSIPQPGDYTCP
jgi:phosphatidylserine/phosphatidylglycerophosphate/cardiolipin synthase-like enzyme